MMIENSNHTLITRLANMFVGKHVKTGVIMEALTLICKNFFFDKGLVYDIDQHHRLNLMEHFGTDESVVPAELPLEEISPEFRNYLANEILIVLNRRADLTEDEERLLDTFDTDSMAAITIVDDNIRIRGLIVLLHNNPGKKLFGNDAEILTVLMSMLSRYVGIRMYQNKLSYAQSSLESILDNTGIDIYVNDFYNHDILYANKSMAAPYGGWREFEGRKCWAVLFPGQTGPCEFCPQKELIDEVGDPTKVYSWDYQRPFDGSWFRVFSAAFRWVDGRLAHVVSSANITDNKNNEELIRYMANYDPLTKLPNRRTLISDCEERIKNLQAEERCFLLFFDIDGFKSINDSLGHDAGDEFLIDLGEFFSGIPMLANGIYRHGGDEFVAVIAGRLTNEHIRNLAGFIHERFHRPWNLKSGKVYSNTSIGVACCPENGTTAEGLLYMADKAMYQIKNSGGGGICFSSQLEMGDIQ